MKLRALINSWISAPRDHVALRYRRRASLEVRSGFNLRMTGYSIGTGFSDPACPTATSLILARQVQAAKAYHSHLNSGRKDARSRSRLLSFTSIVTLACLAMSLLTVTPADAHQAPTGWTYPWTCCSNLDCQEVDAGAISEKPQGYVIQSTGEVVSYGDKRVKNSPDGEYHWCAHQAGTDAGHTICLFVPPKGF